MSVILTGLRANGQLHLGNYLGAISPMSRIQESLGNDDKLFMFVPDLHTITVPVNYKEQYERTLENMRVYIAAGIKPDSTNTILYRQSFVRAHSEMAWIMSCFTPYGEGSRMNDFKDKKQRYDDAQRQAHKISKGITKDAEVGSEVKIHDAQISGKLDSYMEVISSTTIGLFAYPALMAGDILLYSADYVPVGEDQQQHLELTRNTAQRINNKFKSEILNLPKPWKEQLAFTEQTRGVRIRSLQNPTKKMSKSIKDPKGTIDLLDKPESAVKKIMSAETDSVGKVNYDFETQPGVSNLLQMEAYLNNRKVEDVAGQWQGTERYGDLKKQVASSVQEFLTEFQKRYNEVDEADVIEVLERGEARASEIANKTLLRVQKAVGLRR